MFRGQGVRDKLKTKNLDGSKFQGQSPDSELLEKFEKTVP